MGYKKEIKMKVIRTSHVVSFYDGTASIDILSDLQKVPPEAKLAHIDCDINSVNGTSGIHRLIFQLEKALPKD